MLTGSYVRIFISSLEISTAPPTCFFDLGEGDCWRDLVWSAADGPFPFGVNGWTSAGVPALGVAVDDVVALVDGLLDCTPRPLCRIDDDGTNSGRRC